MSMTNHTGNALLYRDKDCSRKYYATVKQNKTTKRASVFIHRMGYPGHSYVGSFASTGEAVEKLESFGYRCVDSNNHESVPKLQMDDIGMNKTSYGSYSSVYVVV